MGSVRELSPVDKSVIPYLDNRISFCVDSIIIITTRVCDDTENCQQTTMFLMWLAYLPNLPHCSGKGVHEWSW